MGAVNFYLKKPGKAGHSLIFLQFKFLGRRLRFSTGKSILPAEWNSKKQRAKSNTYELSESVQSFFYLNEFLNKMEHVTLQAFSTVLREKQNVFPEEVKGILMKEFPLKNSINCYADKVQEKVDFYGLLNKFIENTFLYKNKMKHFLQQSAGYKSAKC